MCIRFQLTLQLTEIYQKNGWTTFPVKRKNEPEANASRISLPRTSAGKFVVPTLSMYWNTFVAPIEEPPAKRPIIETIEERCAKCHSTSSSSDNALTSCKGCQKCYHQVPPELYFPSTQKRQYFSAAPVHQWWILERSRSCAASASQAKRRRLRQSNAHRLRPCRRLYSLRKVHASSASKRLILELFACLALSTDCRQAKTTIS